MFKLKAPFNITNAQKKAVDSLVEGIRKKYKNQVLVGVTGSGKTFVMANLIKEVKMPTLIISHNKTLAAQLYQEMKQFFPYNSVSYFVSYYDYYQPEAYIPTTDTYIEKETKINDQIDKLRLDATSNILSRNDCIIVASVSCIYNIGSPIEYWKYVFKLQNKMKLNHQELLNRLIRMQYERSEFEFKRGTFRIRGQHIDIYSANKDECIRVTIENNHVSEISIHNPISMQMEEKRNETFIYPAKQYIIDPLSQKKIFSSILADAKKEANELKQKGKLIEATRLIKRVNYDIEMIREFGYVNGIENYSRYFDGRSPGEPPFTLLDYFSHRFSNSWLVICDESHITIPQIRGMIRGDESRKKILIQYGFRLSASLDNRPLRFKEFYSRCPYLLYTSATPGPWEMSCSKNTVELLVRPTGIVDPVIKIRSSENDIANLILEIKKQIKKKRRVLVITLTKQQAEDLTLFLKDKKINVQYIHSDIKTLMRTEILKKLRKGDFDVLVGVNLLREGLDIPEVGLVAILDADKIGFLRSSTALIQTMGRASRNVNGLIILYCHTVSNAMKSAIEEINRRRKIQLEYNKKYGIKPKPIVKKIYDNIGKIEEEIVQTDPFSFMVQEIKYIDMDSLLAPDREKIIKKLKKYLKICVKELRFEDAIIIRDKIKELSDK